MSDLNDLLSDDGKAERKEAPEPVEKETQEAAVDAEGVDAEASDATDDEPEQDAGEEEIRPKSVPHERFHAVNERVKELEAKLAASETPKSAPDLSHLFVTGKDDKLPDPIDDPNGYQKAIEQRFNERLFQQGWNVSQNAASRHYGQEVVETALAEFAEQSKTNPLLQEAARGSSDPVGEIVTWHRQQQDWRQIQQAGGLEAYRKMVLEQAGSTPQETQPNTGTQQAAPVMPTDMSSARSSAPRNGGYQRPSLDSLLS